MRRVVKDKTSSETGSIDPDECVIGQVSRTVIDDRIDRADQRDESTRRGTVNITLPLWNAAGIAGRRVAIFIIEEI